ncbi:MAG: hypothetical protein ACT4OS_08900 [Acidimicrobiales bacterium]
MSTYPAGATEGLGRVGRRTFLAAMIILVGVGLTGTFGVRTADVTQSTNGYEVIVSHARVTRPGLATPWSLTVRSARGFPTGQVVISSTAEYFEAFDQNSLDPEPTGAFSDGDRLIWRFEVDPVATTFQVNLDARIEPGIQATRLVGRSEILEEGRLQVAAGYSTLVMP